MNKNNITVLAIYVFFVLGVWSWFVIGVSFFRSRNKPVEKLPVRVGEVSQDITASENSSDSQDVPVDSSDNITLSPTPSSNSLQGVSQSATDIPKQIGSGVPKTISIEKLNINATVDPVGLDNEGNMDVPKSFSTVAWYELGYKVGVKGSAVFSGHFDDTSGKPAVFWDVGKLASGDLIKVTDTTGITYTYRVTSTREYPYDSLPLQTIFASNDNYMLNLITCSGTWNRATRNYSTRMVVYAQQVL